MKPAATNRRITLLAAAFLLLLGAAFARAVLDPGRQGTAVRGDGTSTAPRDDRRPCLARNHRRSQRRAARDRPDGDDGVCEPAAGRRTRAISRSPPEDSSGSTPPSLYPTLVDRSKGFVYVARKADPRKAKILQALDFAGLGFYPEELRFYPQGPVAAQVLGYAGLDNKGLEGLERSLEGSLAGQAGSQTIVKDPFGRALDVVETKPETPGRSVRLTIDRETQANAEEVLQDTVRRWGARAATAVVMNPHTGEVLAMATAPRFNANRFSTTRADRRRNRAVTDTYEPGSTFKLVTIAAGLQEKTSPRARRSASHRRSRSPIA